MTVSLALSLILNGNLGPIAPTLIVQSMPSGDVQSGQFCRAGKTLMLAFWEEAGLWDVATSRRIRTWRQSVDFAKVSADDQWIVLADGARADLIELAGGRRAASFSASGSGINDAAFSPDGRALALAYEDGAVRTYSLITRKLMKTYRFPGIEGFDVSRQVEELRYAAGGRELVANALGSVRRWNVASGTLLAKCEAKGAAKLSATGAYVSDFSGDTLTVWNTSTGKAVGRTSLKGSVPTPEWFFDDSRLAVRMENGRVLVLTNRAAKVAELGSSGSERPLAPAISVSKDGQLLAEAYGGKIRVWNIASRKVLRERETAVGEPIGFSPSNAHVLMTQGSSSDYLLLMGTKKSPPWKPPTDAPAGMEPMKPLGWMQWDDRTVGSAVEKPWSLAGHPATGTLALGTWGGIMLFQRGAGVRRFKPHGAAINSITFSKDGERLLMGSYDRTATIMDAFDGSVSRHFQCDDDVSCAEFSPDETRVVTATSKGTVTIWGVESGLKERELLGTGAHAARWLSSGRLLLLGFGGKQHIVSDSGETLLELPASRGTTEHALSPDRSKLALLEREDFFPTVAIYDLESLKRIRTAKPIQTGSGHVSSLTFSEDSQTLFAHTFDGEGAALDVSTGDPRPYFPNPLPLNAVRISEGECAAIQLNGTVEITDIAKQRTIATILLSDPPISDDPENWTVIAPDGRFDSSDVERIDHAQWVLGTAPFHPVGIEAFMRDYFEPGLLGKVLGRQSMQRIAPPAVSDSRAPTAFMWGLDYNGRPNAPMLVFDITSPVPVSLIRVLRNRRVIAEIENPGQLKKPGKARFRVPIPIDKSSFQSPEVSVYAFSKSGIKGPTEHWTQSDDGLAADEKLYILAIGVERHTNSRWDLSFAGDDAMAVSSAVQRAAKANPKYKEIIALELISDDKARLATKPNVQRVMGVLSGKTSATAVKGIPGTERLAKVRPHDTLLVFWSGHGFSHTGSDFFLVPSDIPSGNGLEITPALQRACVSAEELADWMRPIDCSEMALILDTCQSARAVEGAGFKPGPFSSRSLGQLAYDKGIRILAATQSADVALESGLLAHGLLTYALVKDGLERGLAYPSTRLLSVRQWFDYAAGRVPQLYREVRSGKLKPVLGSRSVIPKMQTKAIAGQIPSVFDFVFVPRLKPVFVMPQGGS